MACIITFIDFNRAITLLVIYDALQWWRHNGKVNYEWGLMIMSAKRKLKHFGPRNTSNGDLERYLLSFYL